MKSKRSKSRVIVPVPENVNQVAKDAYDRGELGAEVYQELVRAGLRDMRELGVLEWTDTAAVHLELPSPPPPVEEYIEVPAPSLSHPHERPLIDHCQSEEGQAPMCVVDQALPEVEVAEEYPVDRGTGDMEVQGDRGEERIGKEECEAAVTEEEEEDWTGQGFYGASGVAESML
ncbi:hypothetical protein LTR29_017579 [Friedmanniomyces endolithicus]|nr:hypothetical protein LTR29_017579 [Friedmanniomyces endolithicus]